MPPVRHAEQSMYECYDDNFFASEFTDPFAESLDIDDSKTHLVGWSTEYLKIV